MRVSTLFPLMGFLGHVLPVLSGDLDPNVDTSNIPDDVALCAEDDDPLNCTGLRRFCVDNTTSGDKFCGPCINGTIEDFTAPEDVEYPFCIYISNITEENFIAAFGDALELGEVEIAVRIAIIWAVAVYISDHNARFPDFKLKLNALAALTPEELAARNGAEDSAAQEGTLDFLSDLQPERFLQELPDKVDWSEMDAVTSIKDQGLCGGCWAFSIAGALEGAAAINSNFTYLDNVSPQQLISCDDQQLGCRGGNVITALQYTMENPLGGVAPYAVVPFTDANGQTTEECPVEPDDPLAVVVPKVALAVSSSQPSDPEERVRQVKQAVAQQPLVVLMDGTCPTIQSYSSGIISDDGLCACASGDCIDHAVLMVGYDDTSNPPSFKYKNSWSTGWGEGGFFRIAQTVSDTQPYGLFGLLYQASTGVGVTNSTAPIPTSAATDSSMWATAIAVGSAVAVSSFL